MGPPVERGPFHEVHKDPLSGQDGGRPGISTALAKARWGLTGREEEVFAFVVVGFTNKQIGSALSLSDATVNRHIDEIFPKAGVNSRTMLIKTVVDEEIVPLSELEGEVSFNRKGFTWLSVKEREVLKLIAEGLSNREIAQRQGGLEITTIKNQITSIQRKIEVDRRYKAMIAYFINEHEEAKKKVLDE